jgi:DNA-directed RNA polymerase specialized sigma24 family protein
LTNYFDRHNCACPDDLADETLNRVARRIEEEGELDATPPARYCYITAKFVLLERGRESREGPLSLDALAPASRESALRSDQAPVTTPVGEDEKRLQCLENCLETLEPPDRELICQYYQGERHWKIENRRNLAMRLGASLNALSIRACRIRSRLEACVRRCMEAVAAREEW